MKLDVLHRLGQLVNSDVYAAYAYELLYTLSKDSALELAEATATVNVTFLTIHAIHYTPHHIAHLTSFDTVRNICRLVERGCGLHFPTQWLVFIPTSSQLTSTTESRQCAIPNPRQATGYAKCSA